MLVVCDMPLPGSKSPGVEWAYEKFNPNRVVLLVIWVGTVLSGTVLSGTVLSGIFDQFVRVFYQISPNRHIIFGMLNYF